MTIQQTLDQMKAQVMLASLHPVDVPECIKIASNQSLPMIRALEHSMETSRLLKDIPDGKKRSHCYQQREKQLAEILNGEETKG